MKKKSITIASQRASMCNKKSMTIVSQRVFDEGLTPTKDGGTCLRRLSMFRKEVH